MQFFSRFDGNNILFLVWILLIVLPFYEIEGKGIKVHRKETQKLEDTEKKIQNKDAEFQYKDAELQLEKLEELRKSTSTQQKKRIRIPGKL